MRASVFSAPVLALVMLLAGASLANAGSVFLTGHDPDFHAVEPGMNNAGAIKINQSAISFVMDPAFNPFVATAPKFLFVEANGLPPAGHVQGKSGMIASGYAEGVDFDHHDAGTLEAALAQLGSVYSAVVIASDFGGLLSQAELDILNENAETIRNFLNDGGGLYAMAQTNNGAARTPGGGHYGFLPRIYTTLRVGQPEVGYSVTAYGASLGLSDADVNGNYSHLIFDSTGLTGVNVVDVDAAGRALTITSRDFVPPIDSPEPGTLLLAGAAVAVLGFRRYFKANVARSDVR